MGKIDGKRIFDLLFSLSGLILLAPLFFIVAVLIKLDSPGGVFFRQERVGKAFVPFTLYKFRTMTVAPRAAPMITSARDSRVTRVGRVLRALKIDELPQLFNVVKGDMSLVGPRPELEEFVGIFEHEYRRILQVRPGITDFAAIQFKDEEVLLAGYDDVEDGYAREILPRKIACYMRYLEERSFFLDLKLILLTMVAIARGQTDRSSET
jgi:lipopolysaccharide/colanic/teichoic acid biosynthesis glycosyltransferase